MNTPRWCNAAWWRRCTARAWAVALGVSTLAGHPALALGQQSDDGADVVRVKAQAANARGLRLVISLQDRRLWAIVGDDTLLDASVGVASGLSLDYQGRRWTFTTPRGRRTIVAKDSLPAWVPPDWHYYEVARSRGLAVRHLDTQPVVLRDGRRLEMRSGTVGLAGDDSTFAPLPADEEIIFDDVLFVPPLGSSNRSVVGPLGLYRIDLGGGYLLHGTPDATSIGEAVTHGCIRLRDGDVAWIYEIIRVGTPVYIY